jgi:hypothetical protein
MFVLWSSVSLHSRSIWSTDISVLLIVCSSLTIAYPWRVCHCLHQAIWPFPSYNVRCWFLVQTRWAWRQIVFHWLVSRAVCCILVTFLFSWFLFGFNLRYSTILINRGCGFLGHIAYSSSLFGFVKFGLIGWSVFVSIRIADFVLFIFLMSSNFARKFQRRLWLFFSKTSKVILVYSNSPDDFFFDGQIKHNHLNIKYTFSVKHNKLIFERAPKKINKKSIRIWLNFFFTRDLFEECLREIFVWEIHCWRLQGTLC